MDKMSLIEEYEKELNEDLYLDEMNAKEKSMRLGLVKQKWANRISKHKIKLKDLIQDKDDLGTRLLGNVNLPVAVSLAKKSKSLDHNEEMKVVNRAIRDQEDIIEFLEASYKNVDSVGWNLKNLIELIKMENY